jgi:uncharacterized protein (TIGR02646 family)
MTPLLLPGWSIGAPRRDCDVRTVDKGAHPSDAQGLPQQFNDYPQCFAPLVARLGRYCSYCERFQPSSLAVEHKRPKVQHPELACTWSNLLLGCANCNSSKGAVVVDATEVLWPDDDDTLSAIEYLPSGRVRAQARMPPDVVARAEKLLALTGLNKTPAEASNRDFRWQDRLEAWSQALQAREDLAGLDSPALRRSIVNMAVNKGFFSVWYAAFAGHEEMRTMLVAAFPGTVLRAA